MVWGIVKGYGFRFCGIGMCVVVCYIFVCVFVLLF